MDNQSDQCPIVLSLNIDKTIHYPTVHISRKQWNTTSKSDKCSYRNELDKMYTGTWYRYTYQLILIICYVINMFFNCFQYTYTGEFIVQKKHYLYHDIQTQLHLVI